MDHLPPEEQNQHVVRVGFSVPTTSLSLGNTVLLVVVVLMFGVHTNPGKSWNLKVIFSRPGKSWNQADVLERRGR